MKPNNKPTPPLTVNILYKLRTLQSFLQPKKYPNIATLLIITRRTKCWTQGIRNLLIFSPPKPFIYMDYSFVCCSSW